MEFGTFLMLALCAFGAAFADDSTQDMDEIYVVDYEGNFSSLDDKIHAPVFDAAKAMKIKGMNSVDIASICIIGQPEHAKYQEQYQAAYDQCEQCYKKQQKTKDTKAARKCCDKIYAALEKQGDLARDQCLACLAKCTKLGTKCKKMIKSTDEDERKKKKNNDGTKNNKNQDTHESEKNKNQELNAN